MASAQSRTAKRRQNKPQDVGDEMKRASKHPWVQNLARMGYVGRGLLFAAIGFLALQVALGNGGQPKDQTGALAAIATQPFGRVLLIVIAIGLVGFSLWGFIRAAFDPLRRGNDTGGIIARIGFLISGISYGLLVFPTIQLITGASTQPQNSTQKTQDITAQVMQQPWGPWAIGIVGSLVIAWAVAQLYQAYTGKFELDFKSHVMTRLEKQWAEPIGRVGISARALVFTLIGAFFIQAALQHDPQDAKGLDGALLAIAQWSGGPWILILVALGLIIFGLYSILAARWMDVT